MRRTHLVLSLLVLGACGGSKGATPAGTGGSAGTGVAGAIGHGGAESGASGSLGGAGATGGAVTGVAGAGSAGTGGAGTGGGAAGSSGTAGAVGSGGTAGGGAAGTSGAAGAPSGAECRTAEDCMLASDCCRCQATPKGTPADSCPAICKVDRCTELGIQLHEVTCAFGRCVLARSCVTSAVLCPALPPNCAAGSVPSVLGSCWGPCLPPTECNGVTNCNSCPAGTVCARHDLRGYGCVTAAPDCHAGSYCGCLGACEVGCAETDGGVGCFCPGC